MNNPSQIAAWIDTLYAILVQANTIIGALVLFGLVAFVVHYRQREARARAGSRRWHLPLGEILWSSLPFAILLGVVAWGLR